MVIDPEAKAQRLSLGVQKWSRSPRVARMDPSHSYFLASVTEGGGRVQVGLRIRKYNERIVHANI